MIKREIFFKKNCKFVLIGKTGIVQSTVVLLLLINYILLFSYSDCIADLIVDQVITGNYIISNPGDLKITKDGKKGYVSLSKNHSILVIDFTKESPSVVSQIKLDPSSTPKFLAINSVDNNDLLYVLDDSNNKLIVINIDNDSVKEQLDLKLKPNDFIVSQDGNYIIINFHSNDEIRVYDTKNLSLITNLFLEGDPDICSMAISNNKLFAVSSYYKNSYSDDQNMYVIDMNPDNFKVLEYEVAVGKNPYMIVSNNDYVFVSHELQDSKISVFDINSYSQINTIGIKNSGYTQPKNSTNMAMLDYLIFIINPGDTTFSMINTNDDKVQTYHISGNHELINLNIDKENKKMYVLRTKSIAIIDIEPLLKFNLNIVKSGRGTIKSNPIGISCGQNCSAMFNMNSNVNLLAEPEFEYTFSGWSEPNCQISNNCALSMNKDITIIANFTKPALPFSKAIIVAGYGNYNNNLLWKETKLCSDKAYDTLDYQEYDLSNIYYLSHDPTYMKIDNKIINVVANEPSIENMDYALKKWLFEDGKQTNNLLLYMVGHGGEDIFCLRSDEFLKVDTLKTWLNEIQEKISGKIIIIYDGCESGSFIDDLSNENRIIITSCEPGKNATFGLAGSLSFSFQFWNYIQIGADLKKAFEIGSRHMEAYQTPQINTDGDKEVNEHEDDILACEKILIGFGNKPASDIPIITKVSQDVDLINTTTANIWIEAKDADGISDVWGIIIGPDSNMHLESNTPITELLNIKFTLNNGFYTASYDKFNKKGVYKILVYAKDYKNYYSDPSIIKITQNCPGNDINKNCKVDMLDVLMLIKKLIHH